MKTLNILFLLFLLNACASVDKLEISENCQVWREQPLFGPVHVSAGNKRASWSGLCKNLWWDCKNVTGYIEDNGDVYVNYYVDYKLTFDDNKPIGRIKNQVFTDSRVNPFSSMIDTTPMRVDLNSRVVKYNIKFRPVYDSKEILTHFNKACSVEDALIGTLVLNAVDSVQSEAHRP